jgi:Methyltransferase domain
LFLRSFAHRAERYLGIDVSPAAIEAAGRDVDAGWDHVRLRVGDADALAGLGSGEFDLVMFNSVVQYFPSLTYLRRALAEAVRIAGPDGAVFVGDVRDAELLEAFHTSVVFHHARADTPAAELTEMVRRRVSMDGELYLAGEFFAEFAAGAGVSVSREIKRGLACNELTSFHYDVTLLGAQRAGELDGFSSGAESVPWERVGDLAGLKELLDRAGPGALTATGIPNSRLVRPLALCGLLAEAAPTDPASDIERRLAEHDHADVPDIESVAELVDRSGRSVRFVPDARGAWRYEARIGPRR